MWMGMSEAVLSGPRRVRHPGLIDLSDTARLYRHPGLEPGSTGRHRLDKRLY